MTHWGWYWKIKRQHTPKPLCTWGRFLEIDSFSMFKNSELVRLVHESADRISFEIPRYNLTAILMPNNYLHVTYSGGSYEIPVESKSCNYGGVYHFFHCPQCQKRMRKLYCDKGRYACRKCLKLCYKTQQLRPYRRYLVMRMKIEEKLKNRTGSLCAKPHRMRTRTFRQHQQAYLKYDEKWFYAANQELRDWGGAKAEPFIDEYYFPPFFLPDDDTD
jgi:hypothetical protein